LPRRRLWITACLTAVFIAASAGTVAANSVTPAERGGALKAAPKARPAPPRSGITPPRVTPAQRPVQGGQGPLGTMLSTGSGGVALTFDDGPDPVYTPRLLAQLRQHGVKATFCLVGSRVQRYPEIVRQIVAGGHTLCNHTWRHSVDLRKKSIKVITHDLEQTNHAIATAVPGVKVRYFRAAGGAFGKRLVRLASKLGMRSLYWSVDTRDWEHRRFGRGRTMVRHIVSILYGATRRGSIILAHDLNKPDTLAAFGEVLPWLRSHVNLIALRA
jgi:peptidoglycan/xylan/chitin deacetylase (PgdA/CDA1 family)